MWHQGVYLSYSGSKVHTNTTKTVILNNAALIQWSMGGICCATKDLLFN